MAHHAQHSAAMKQHVNDDHTQLRAVHKVVGSETCNNSNSDNMDSHRALVPARKAPGAP